MNKSEIAEKAAREALSKRNFIGLADVPELAKFVERAIAESQAPQSVHEICQGTFTNSGAAQEASPPSPDTAHIWDSITRVAESRHDYGVCTLTRSACQKLIGEKLHDGDTRELKAALEDCIKIAARFVNSCDTQNIAATIYAHIKGRARSVGVF